MTAADPLLHVLLDLNMSKHLVNDTQTFKDLTLKSIVKGTLKTYFPGDSCSDTDWKWWNTYYNRNNRGLIVKSSRFSSRVWERKAAAVFQGGRGLRHLRLQKRKSRSYKLANERVPFHQKNAWVRSPERERGALGLWVTREGSQNTSVHALLY